MNYEIRELLVTGLRPARGHLAPERDHLRQDRLGARISYGGRGQITDVQQPRYGQQIADIILPF